MSEQIGGAEYFLGEKFNEWRTLISGWREQSQAPRDKIMALGLIEIASTLGEKLGKHEEVVNLRYEQSLVGKHIVMGVDHLARNGGVALPIAVMARNIGINTIERGAEKARAYMDKHQDFEGRDFLHARLGRFFGDAAMLRGEYHTAVKYLEKASYEFQKFKDPESRKNYLELNGFLAEAMINDKSSSDGISLAIQTYQTYSSDEWSYLKKDQRYLWSVWRSGCVIKTLRAIMNQGIVREVGPEQRNALVAMFSESEKDLHELMKHENSKMHPDARVMEFSDLRNDLEAINWL